MSSPFAIFWISRAIAALSATSAPVVFTFAVLQESGGQGMLSQALSFQVLAQLLALLVSGPVIDRVNRKWFLVLAQLATGILWAVFAAVLMPGNVPDVLFPVFGAALGLLSGFNGPATQSVVSMLVSRDQLKGKLAELRITLNTVSVLVPVAAGLALGMMAPGTVILGLAAANILSGLQLCRLPGMRVLPGTKASSTPKDAGWGGARRRMTAFGAPWFWYAVCATALMNVLWAGYYQLNGPVILQGSSSSPELAWGAASAALGAGMIVGGFVFKRVTFRNPRSTPMLFLAGKALPVLAFGLWPHPVLIAVTAFSAGLLLEAFVLNFHTQVQLTVPERLLGTAYSADAFVGMALMPVGYALAAAGPFDQLSSQSAAGTLMVVLAVAGWFAIRRSRDREKVLETVGR